MNELQLSLLGLGVLAILLVVVYNRWLERKFHKAREVRSEQPEQQAVTGARQEPQWDRDVSEDSVSDNDSQPLDTESGLSDALEVLDPSETIQALSDVEAWVDAIATLRFYEPRSAGSIRETIEHIGEDRFERIYFYSGDAWHLADKLPIDALVSNVRCHLQLATRRGPVSPDALHEWMRSVEALSQTLSAGLSVESEAAMIERAGSLDLFCSRVDALINLNLRSRDLATVKEFSEILETQKLSGVYPDFVRLNAFGEIDFQVVADEAKGLVSVTMDFPHVNRPDLVVGEMLLFARMLAEKLDAEIVDDAGRSLGENGMALLSNQVVRLAAMLQAQGIEPGSVLSRRLFS